MAGYRKSNSKNYSKLKIDARSQGRQDADRFFKSRKNRIDWKGVPANIVGSYVAGFYDGVIENWHKANRKK